jgi:hypothetical protein
MKRNRRKLAHRLSLVDDHDSPRRPDVRSGAHDRAGGQDAMLAEVRRELFRSRRTGRPFCLLRIASAIDVPPPMTLASIRRFTRVIDRAWVDEDGLLWVLLPETGADAIVAFIARIRREEPLALAGCSIGLASFPETALTLETVLDTSGVWFRVATTAESAAPRREGAGLMVVEGAGSGPDVAEGRISA